MCATHMRMSCALSRSLLLAELMKMPSSSVAELLEANRLCRPTRPFQPRPGEALHTQPAPRLEQLSSQTLVSFMFPCILVLVKLILMSKFHVSLL